MKKNRLFINMIIIGVLFLIVFMLNIYTPIVFDDYSYMYSFATGERIASIKDIIISQMAHYSCMNGRVLVHSLAQLFLMINPYIFDVFNTLSFMILAYLMCFHAVGEFKKITMNTYLIVYGLLFIFTPAFGQSYLWTVGSANYMYSAIILLLFLIPFRKDLTSENKKKFNLIYFCLFCVFGFATGMCNENTGVAVISYLFILIAILYLTNRTFDINHIIPMICAGIGFLFMIFSPGTMNRLSNAGGTGGIASLLKRVVFISSNCIEYFFPLVIIVVICLIYNLWRNYSDNSNAVDAFITFVNNHKYSLIYFVTFMLSCYSMCISPSFPDRAWTTPLVLLIIAVINIYNDYIENSSRDEALKNIISFVMFVCICFNSCNAYLGVKTTYVAFKEREAIINECKENGTNIAQIPDLLSDNKYSCYDMVGDLNNDFTQWPNADMAKYYNVERIEKIK